MPDKPDQTDGTDQATGTPADGTGETTQQPTGGGQPNQQQSTDGQDAGQGENASGEPDQKDYRKLYEQVLAESRKWESRAKDNSAKAKKWDEAEEAQRSEAEKQQARADTAEARAQSAMTSAINAEIRAAAHGWANPSDAPRYLDDKTRYVNDDGDIDTDAIATDVASVLDDRPHLAAADPRRGPSPDPGQGHRGGVSVDDQIKAAENKGDYREALRLKTTQLLDQKPAS